MVYIKLVANKLILDTYEYSNVSIITSSLFYFLFSLSIILTSCSKEVENKPYIMDERITSVSIDRTNTKVEIGKTINLKFFYSPDNLMAPLMSWSSIDKEIAIISQDGVVMGISEGQSLITLQGPNDTNLIDTCTITVFGIDIESVKITMDSIEIEKGQSYELKTTIIPNNAHSNSLIWTSSDNKIAIVNNGIVTGVSEGQCYIEVESPSNVKDSCLVKVVLPKLYDVTLLSAGLLRESVGGKNQFSKIKRLKICGPINGNDIEDIRNMPFLEYLDIEYAELIPGGVYFGDNVVKKNEIDNWMFYKLTELKTIILPKDVFSIGFHAFDDCDNLETCILPISLNKIGYASFSHCVNLKNISFPESLISIGYQSFFGCNSITSIIIPDNVKLIGINAFSACDKLEKINIGSGVQSIGSLAFYNSININKIIMNTIPNEDTKFATDIFSEETYSKAELHIPKGMKYKFEHTPFENFKTIVEF